ncbi:MAG: YbaB/EbfC family nucleoid-associated protein [Nitrospirota bacterium]
MSKKMFGDIMRQAQVMQEKMAKTQEKLAQKSVDASSGGGMVKVAANGKHEIVSIKIDPSVINSEDVEMLEDLVLAAANEALRKASEMVSEEMKNITGGLNVPGMLKGLL